MEKLNLEKFDSLSCEELSQIEGGGWRVEVSEVYYNDYGCYTFSILQRYSWGSATGEYKESRD